MGLSRLLSLHLVIVIALGTSAPTFAQSLTSSASHRSTHSQGPSTVGIEPGAVVNGVYRNKTLGLSCKIPPGWVLRTEEMNAHDANDPANPQPQKTQVDAQQPLLLLAAFSRPPDARGEDVNASIVIAAESVQAYPGLKEAAQYFAPLTEVATAQGFTPDEEPYEFEVSAKKLVRGDFHKDVGTRVMHQSTLVWLAHGYAVSITVIAGTEDDLESLIDGVTFTPGK